MKNKKIVLLLLTVFLLSGCAKNLTTTDKKVVKNEKTGVTLIQNILCKPTDKTSIKQYKDTYEETLKSLDEELEKKEITKKDYDKQKKELVDIDELPTCKNFTISSGNYEGIWNTIFVKPLSWVIIKLGLLVKNYGLAVILITLVLRLLLFPLTQKTAMQSENMNKAKKDLDNLEKKYKGKTDQESVMQKNQEMMVIYKKYGINPASGCIFSIIQVPIFFAFYESLNRLPVILEGKFLGFNLGMSPLKAMSLGKYYYVIFIILVVLVTYLSFKLNKTAISGNDQEKQMKIMTLVMVGLIGFASFDVSIAIALYWITNSAFTVIQNLLVKRGKKNENVIRNK